VLARMLRNLKEIHRSAADWVQLLAVQQRLVLLLPGAAEERRDRGLAWAELGRADAAVDDLEAYLAQQPDAPDAEELRQRVHALRRPGRTQLH
jgi:regulator of sirC expression with transglutaminase-like and TPR domain